MSIKSRVVLLSVFALIALAACTPKDADKNAASAAASGKDTVAATVNGMPISQNAIDRILKQQHGMPDTPETRKLIIDNLAMQLLVAQEAVKKGLDKTPEVLDELEFAKQSLLAQAYVQDYFKNNAVTDDQLKSEYDKLKAQSSGTQYKARHILVKEEKEAKEIIASLQKDIKSFDALAKAKSLDPGSKSKGGDLGWFDAHSMVAEFSAAVAKLEKGKFTQEPVKSQYGYHVIILDDTRANTSNIPPLEQIKAGLTQQIQQQNLKKYVDELKTKAKIDIVAAPAAAPAPVAPVAPAAAPVAPAVPAAEPAKK